jgi:hypothetical protein
MMEKECIEATADVPFSEKEHVIFKSGLSDSLVEEESRNS